MFLNYPVQTGCSFFLPDESGCDKPVLVHKRVQFSSEA